jgi:hypothetical protein
MADAPDLGSGAARRGGSSPPSRNSNEKLVTKLQSTQFARTNGSIDDKAVLPMSNEGVKL